MSKFELDRLCSPAPLRLWALIGAGPVLTITAAGMTLVIWRGGWEVALQPKQMDILGFALMANWLLLSVVVVALASVKLRGQGPAGVEFEIEGAANSEPIGPSPSMPRAAR